MIEPSADDGESKGAEEMGPDVDELVVDVEEGGEGAAVAVAVGAVPGHDEVVVAPPRRQVVPEHQQLRRDLMLNVLSCLQ